MKIKLIAFFGFQTPKKCLLSEEIILKYYGLGYYSKRYDRYIEIFVRASGVGQIDNAIGDAVACPYWHSHNLRLGKSD